VNRFNPFGPHIINRGAKGVTQKIRENWVTIFELSSHYLHQISFLVDNNISKYCERFLNFLIKTFTILKNIMACKIFTIKQ
ncbi:hypothetical protein BpHYR1_043659, partial [Brachionus plicatilis]